ncbi:uncharacterized protein ACHE_70700S [Aspergillus chevalieri]|uniref:Secreted protein n=1 Tax=Aspergillus chevalieri TaxID=182096 RepID=A0A7R7VW32_ASPCH|nr:uncharacterized protein ACHE_70700S [Aspergillus chevalieri]BCR91857.1 hypothetical protein ACHE_70700S [Aspergillus chevalieri]
MTQATVACRTVCLAFAVRVLQCLLKLNLRSNQMPSQRVAPPGGGGVTFSFTEVKFFLQGRGGHQLAYVVSISKAATSGAD